MAIFSSDDPDSADKMRLMIDPGQVDHQIRQAIQIAWMALPAERKSIAEVERVIRHIVDRALKDYREDGELFSQGI